MSPIAGIGSEGYVSVKMGRRFVGQELKRSYFDSAVGYLRELESEMSMPNLFAWAARNAEVAAL